MAVHYVKNLFLFLIQLFNSSVVPQHALDRKKYKKTTVDAVTSFLSAVKRLGRTLFTRNLFAWQLHWRRPAASIEVLWITWDTAQCEGNNIQSADHFHLSVSGNIPWHNTLLLYRHSLYSFIPLYPMGCHRGAGACPSWPWAKAGYTQDRFISSS